ncbi:MAG: CYTH domain-containing protein [Sphingobacteriales bacterium]
MALEIERKFLVDHQKWQQVIKPAGTHFRQGYLLNDDKRTIRIRVTGEQGFITIKGATLGITRKEYEYKIPVEEGIELLDAFAVSGVEKTRYCIEFAGKTWEVDEFAGDNTGLIIAEIELENETEAFAKPAWVTIEVSDDVRYYNSNLSIHPYKNW